MRLPPSDRCRLLLQNTYTSCGACQVKRVRQLSTLPPGIAASIAEANKELSSLLGDDALGYVSGAPAPSAPAARLRPASRQYDPLAAPAPSNQSGAAVCLGHTAERPVGWAVSSLGSQQAPEADAAPGLGGVFGKRAEGAWAPADCAGQHSAQGAPAWHSAPGAEARALPEGGPRQYSEARGSAAGWQGGAGGAAGAATAGLTHVDRYAGAAHASGRCFAKTNSGSCTCSSATSSG